MTLRFSIAKPGISACAAALASCAAIRSWLGFSITAPNTLASLCSSTGLTSTSSSRARSKSSYRALVGVIVRPRSSTGAAGSRNSSFPASQPGCQVAGPDSAFLGQFAGLAVDRLHPVDGVGPNVRAGEQPGEPAAAGLLEPLKRLGIGAGEVEGAGPAVLVVEQRIAAAQIRQRVDPLPLSSGDQLQVTGVVWFCHGAPFARDRSASPSESQQTEFSDGDGKSGNRVLGRRA